MFSEGQGTAATKKKKKRKEKKKREKQGVVGNLFRMFSAPRLGSKISEVLTFSVGAAATKKKKKNKKKKRKDEVYRKRCVCVFRKFSAQFRQKSALVKMNCGYSFMQLLELLCAPIGVRYVRRVS